MIYSDIETLKNLVHTREPYTSFHNQIQLEVDDYFANFEDDPQRTSRWAHHYFCETEGARLTYNDKTPNRHVCSVCGREYIDHELFFGCWITMYRNQGVTNAWKSALVYKVTGEEKYLQNLMRFASFYNDNYLEFTIHNKEGEEFENLESAKWGVSRIMPQSLNEAIFLIRLTNALELVKEDLSDDFLKGLYRGMYSQAFEMFKPQVDKIHNIPTWLNSAIGVMGHFFNDKEMIDFTYNGPFNIVKQLKQGVTEDAFWYEGSIHYNFFLLESVVNLLLFQNLYSFDFPLGKEIVEKMLEAAYLYAFDNDLLPNPNDGWPDVNLKTYSYIYALAVKILGEESRIAQYLGAILNKEVERGTVPLSKPYYFENDISLEEVLFVPTVREKYTKDILRESLNFKSSYCGILRGHGTNVFLKYGHNGPSHAHPDKMSVEVFLKGEMLSHDLSNSGYGNPLCNEWHRMSPSHNTVVVNGESHSSFEGGKCLIDEPMRIQALAEDVYDGVDFQRQIEITEEGFSDQFEVSAEKDSTFDYFFHIEGPLDSTGPQNEGDLGYSSKGYQHLKNLKRWDFGGPELDLRWKLGTSEVSSLINAKETEVFWCQSPDNSVAGLRNTIILRQKGKKAKFSVEWKVLVEE